MYHNSGAKVKGLATILVALMMIACVAIGIFVIVEAEVIGLGLIIIFGGCLVSWLSGLMMAAFGELVQNSYKILKILSENKTAARVASPADVPVTHAATQRNGAPYGDAATVAQEEKVYDANANSDANTNVNAAICPNCGAPRKGNSSFCAFCGTKL